MIGFMAKGFEASSNQMAEHMMVRWIPAVWILPLERPSFLPQSPQPFF